VDYPLPHDDVGDGRTLVLLHAGVADRSMWAEHLQPLADEGFRVVAFDMPAFGDAPVNTESDAPWLDVLSSIEALGLDAVTIVGVSWGGAVAQRVAVLAPQLVAGLVLVSSVVPGLEPSPQLLAAAEAEDAAIEAEDIDGVVNAALDSWLLADPTPQLRERVGAMHRHTMELQLAIEEPPPGADPVGEDADVLRSIEAPTLVLVGEYDMSDFHDSAQELERLLPNAERAVIADAGHLAPLERPQEFRDLLLSFLAAHPHA
jgi:3-oxoadipate enol-lactonase